VQSTYSEKLWHSSGTDSSIPFADAGLMSLQELKEILTPNVYSKYVFDNIPTTKTKVDKMKNIKNQVVQANTNAAQLAAQQTAGNVLNKTLLTKVRPQMPMMLRGYSEHALAEVVVANLANFAVANFAADNEKAVWATEAMMVAAMTNLLGSFNIESIVKDLLDEVSLPDFNNTED